MNTKHEKAYTFLKHHSLGILATASSASEPWGSAIYYIVDEQLNFYFLTHTETLKYRNIQHSHRASLVVTDNDAQTTVQVVGDITEPEETSDEYNDAFRKLADVRPPKELRWRPPVSKIHTSKTVLLRLTPTYLQFADFDSRQTSHDIADQINLA